MKTKLLSKLRKEAFDKVSVYFVVGEYGGRWCVRTDFSAFRATEYYGSMTEANTRATATVKEVFREIVEQYKNLHERGKRNFYPW